jgi:uncharacterized protein YdhG (YjbR/CyaY superfamily)
LNAFLRHTEKGPSRDKFAQACERDQKMIDSKSQPKTIDEYVSSYPENVRSMLEEVRKILHEEALEAQETIKYQIPTFTLSGNLMSFAAYKHHIGLHPVPSTTEAFKKELAPYRAAKSTLRFPIDKPLPLSLIRKVVRQRVKDWKEKK